MNTTTTTQWETTKLASPSYAPKIGIYTEPGDLLAVVSGGNSEEVEERAKLISAAPDLLAALTWIVERLERGGRAAVSDAISQAQSAIAKATN